MILVGLLIASPILLGKIAGLRGLNWFRGNSGILESLNVREIEAVGELFDPNFHDALAQEPSDDYESGVVTREMIKGYQIGDKVVRPSLVFVAE